jgi:hypothetical protein
MNCFIGRRNWSSDEDGQDNCADVAERLAHMRYCRMIGDTRGIFIRFR